jgi:hypothetical protein
MVSTAGWTTAARWPLITTRSARYAPVATDRRTRADRRLSRVARPRGCHRRQRDARLALANARRRYDDVIGNFPVWPAPACSFAASDASAYPGTPGDRSSGHAECAEAEAARSGVA